MGSSASRPSDKQVGSFCATLGCVLAAVALFLNELVGLYDDKDSTSAFGYCGFDGLRVESDTGYLLVEYGYCCDDDTYCNDLTLSAYFTLYTSSYWTIDADKSDFCDTEASGWAWLCFGCIGLLLALVAIGAVAFQRDYMSKFGEIGACLCAAIACAAFYINNDVCWDDDRVDDEEVRLGWSMYLMITAAVAFALGGFCSR